MKEQLKKIVISTDSILHCYVMYTLSLHMK